MTPQTFRRRLLSWFNQYGRKDLPWQKGRTAYRVWVSEVMLQQTQVATVIPYYRRFVKRFPNIKRLAEADIDEVLHHWTGLGYYARARNLHKTAGLIRNEHNGRFPQRIDDVVALPGIGRSTAGAILALAYDQRHPILDGNVKRVLTRLHAIDRWPGEKQTLQKLWSISENYIPLKRVADYTQAIMDLGATVCVRATPRCDDCPVHSGCIALKNGNVTDYPVTGPRKTLPEKYVTMLMVQRNEKEVLLTRRPPTGIWGGLWGFPESEHSDARLLSAWSSKTLGLEIKVRQRWPVVRHTFSHFHLHIHPVTAEVVGKSTTAMEMADAVWYKLDHPDRRGLAAPVKRLLQQLRNET
ncbi:MAG: A/G-specific adenine glycosylase [Acidiferrobacterales bacterium]